MYNYLRLFTANKILIYENIKKISTDDKLKLRCTLKILNWR